MCSIGILQQMYFIRSVCNAESPRLGIHLSDQLILAHPFCTIDLNGSIQHSSCNLRDNNLHVNLIAFERQTFAIAMCVKAPFAPTRSIISAAFSTRSLADSISNLNSASCARKRSWSFSDFPNGLREGSTALARIKDIALSQLPIQRILL